MKIDEKLFYCFIQNGRTITLSYHIQFVSANFFNQWSGFDPILFYNILFKAASQTLLTFGENEIGGKLKYQTKKWRVRNILTRHKKEETELRFKVDYF